MLYVLSCVFIVHYLENIKESNLRNIITKFFFKYYANLLENL